MAHKKKRSMGRTLLKVVTLVPTLFSVFTNITALVGWEAKRAGKSVVTIILFAFFAAFLLTTIWLCLLGILFLYLVSLHWTEIQALLFIILVNVILLGVIGFVISKVKNNLTFPLIRKQLQIISQLSED